MKRNNLIPELPFISITIVGFSLIIMGAYIIFSNLDNYYSDSFLGFMLLMIGSFGFLGFGNAMSIILKFSIIEHIERKELKKQLGVKTE